MLHLKTLDLATPSTEYYLLGGGGTEHSLQIVRVLLAKWGINLNIIHVRTKHNAGVRGRMHEGFLGIGGG